MRQIKKIYSINDLKISLLKKSDIKDILDMLQNVNVCKYLFFAPAPDEIYRSYYESIANEMNESLITNSNNIIFIVRYIYNNQFIGECGLSLTEKNKTYEIAYQLREEYWNKKIGTIMCKFTLNYIFNKLKGKKAIANCYTTNTASRKILKKCCFHFDGYTKGFLKENNKFINRANYSITKSEYFNNL